MSEQRTPEEKRELKCGACHEPILAAYFELPSGELRCFSCALPPRGQWLDTLKDFGGQVAHDEQARAISEAEKAVVEAAERLNDENHRFVPWQEFSEEEAALSEALSRLREVRGR